MADMPTFVLAMSPGLEAACGFAAIYNDPRVNALARLLPFFEGRL
jgi:hypothetical protein